MRYGTIRYHTVKTDSLSAKLRDRCIGDGATVCCARTAEVEVPANVEGGAAHKWCASGDSGYRHWLFPWGINIQTLPAGSAGMRKRRARRTQRTPRIAFECQPDDGVAHAVEVLGNRWRDNAARKCMHHVKKYRVDVVATAEHGAMGGCTREPLSARSGGRGRAEALRRVVERWTWWRSAGSHSPSPFVCEHPAGAAELSQDYM
ncbi:hypothetical protein DFH06DRAFT_1365769 [Mycena polygramma]|nr:hypothetical protein DFH06DRAFT_1365769 [Mycena polygramma]